MKTSQRDELKEVDEAGGLLSRECPIRFIITKQALQEGWDCSFAYVLAILTNPGSKTALTQLVGRILRQPYARKTHVQELDESYVFSFQRKSLDLLREVRKGFGLEGLQGLEGRVNEDAGERPGGLIVSEQRERFRQAAASLVLPTFMIRDGRRWRLVHYEADILSRIPWDEVDVSPLFSLDLQAQGSKDVTLRAGLDFEPLFADAEQWGTGERGVRRHRHLLRRQPPAGRHAQPLARRRSHRARLQRLAREAPPRESAGQHGVHPRRTPQALGSRARPLVPARVRRTPRRRHDALHRRHRRPALQPPAATHRATRHRAPSQPRGRQPVPTRPLRPRERRRAQRPGEQGGHLLGHPSPPFLLVPPTAHARTTTSKAGNPNASTPTSSSPCNPTNQTKTTSSTRYSSWKRKGCT